MKIKILDKGYEALTGYFGSVLFDNGVSVEDVSRVDANMIAAVLTVVDAETGKAVGQAHIDFDNWDKPQQTVRLKTRAEIKAEAKGKPQAPVQQVMPQVVADTTIYTQEQLEAVADDKGIAGLREIGDPLNAKAKSIPALIAEILRAQQRSAFAPKVAE